MIVGLLHPGEMGAAVGARVGAEVIWASEGRSDATRVRGARFRDVDRLDALLAEANVVLSICPPHAALDVARACAGFEGIYVDANAISPMRAREIGELHSRFVDASIIGGPSEPLLCLTGAEAPAVAALFSLETRLVPDASALKMAYAAWSKGSAALLLAIREVARSFGVEEDWRMLTPELGERLAGAERSAAAKGWRFVGELEEIAATFAAAGQPDGFHRAAAQVHRA
ncbi:MAG TPA: DUF1932 domain-containing protein [Gaiellaceae bacterium]|nr:DUF1932 domain-containing protein [Gaiellaceae bacterium]